MESNLGSSKVVVKVNLARGSCGRCPGCAVWLMEEALQRMMAPGAGALKGRVAVLTSTRPGRAALQGRLASSDNCMIPRYLTVP